ncbi:HNH endonuclease [Bacillus carboniphilus]|uniref:HNH endonuclease n=1 Tax=Bacillus carboniphilus TaxID=86663 RepID=A0ABY9JV08_9BACI|nr:HNH endonuclease [Bacillus carboniphilus]WLR43225.1 HNH endonuclease [Bacillus carboniphilus]
MARDLKINYGVLDGIIEQLHVYKRALDNMESSLQTISQFAKQNQGKSVDSWIDRIEESKEYIKGYQDQIENLLNLFESYVEDTTSYISPLSRNAMMRIDRDDIWVNLLQIEKGITRNVLKAKNIAESQPFYSILDEPTESEIKKSNSNKAKLSSIRNEIKATETFLSKRMDELWELYDTKVKRFENVDDDYKSKASKVKNQYTDFFEGVWDGLEANVKADVDFIRGLSNGLYELAKGLYTIVEDAGIIYLSQAIPDFVEPEILKSSANQRIDKYTASLQQIIEDPMGAVESIGQSFSDTYEEEGIAYVTGGAVPSFIPYAGQLEKITKVGKLGNAIDGKKPVPDEIKTKVKDLVGNHPAFQGVRKGTIQFIKDVKDGSIIFIDGVRGGVQRLTNPDSNFAYAFSGARNVLNSQTIQNKINAVLFKLGVKSRVDEVIKNDYDADGNLVNRSVVPKGYSSVDDFLSKVDNNTIKEYGYKNVVEFKEVVALVDKHLNESPKSNIINKKLAGGTHPSGVEFDVLGFPIFKGENLKYTLNLDEKFYHMKDTPQFEECTRVLKDAIIKGEVSKSIFTKVQLDQIMNEKARISGLTWHHHQVSGRMQLVVKEIHVSVGHLGGNTLWGEGIR